MNFYIATKLDRAKEHNIVRDDLVKLNWHITYDWTTHGSVKNTTTSTLTKVANSEANGVINADVVIVLLPGGRGTHTELGLAIASNKKVILHSSNPEMFKACEETCAFYHHSNTYQYCCDINQLVDLLVKDKFIVENIALELS